MRRVLAQRVVIAGAITGLCLGISGWILVQRGAEPELFSPYSSAHRELLWIARGRPPSQVRLSGFGASMPERVSQDALAFAGAGLSARLQAEAQIERDLSATPTSAALAAAAVRDLLSGEFSRAVVGLEEARLGSPLDPRLLNDLAAAYLARGLDADRPLDLLAGLGHAGEAVNAQDERPEPRFNFALALDSLHLPQARGAWQAYLEFDDGDSAWAKRARQRSRALAEPAPYQVWERVRPELFRAAVLGDELQVREAIATFPMEVLTEAESWLFTELPDAGERREPERLEEIAAAIRFVGRELDARAGGALLFRSAAQLGEGWSKAIELGAAYRDLGEALAAVERFDVAGALNPASKASRRLASLASPYEARARYVLAVSWYQQSRYDEARELLRQVCASARGYGDLETEAQGLELLGQIEAVESRFGLALEHKEAARDLYRRAGWVGRVAAVEGSLAEILDLVGDQEMAWLHRINALRDLGSVSRARVRFRILADATDAAHDRQPLSLRYFADALRTTAQEADHPLLWLIALKKRAGVLAWAGDAAGARRDLDEAEIWLDRVPDRTHSDTLRAGILAARGRALLETDPAAALPILDRAIDLYRSTGYEAGMPEVLRLRAEAHRSQEDSGRAEADLSAAVQAVELQATSLRDLVELAGFFEVSRPLYDGMIDLLVEAGDPERALEFDERSRWIAGVGSAKTAAALRDWSARLPPEACVIVYRVLDRRLVIWGLRREGVVAESVAIPYFDLVRLVNLLRQAILWGERPEALTERLYDLLLRPVASTLEGASDLVVVPDTALQGVPFAALRESESGRLLAEDFRVTTSPSVGDAVWSLLQAGRETFDAQSSVLAVGQPLSRFPPGLPPLPGARVEVERIARRFPRTMLIVGDLLSPSRFLEAARGHQILHFAGHVIPNERRPFQSSLVLSAEAPEDSLLLADRVLRQDLSNVRLAVLSGCSSATGQGGATHMAASFLAAGVPVVVASLWDVGDRTTVQFFERFYERLSGGFDPASAFHHAQLQLLQSEDPSESRLEVWAAFQMSRRFARPEEGSDHGY